MEFCRSHRCLALFQSGIVGDDNALTFFDALPPDSIASFYRNISVLLLTSAYEGVPMSIIEARCLGVPVVATHVGGVADLLDGSPVEALVDRTANNRTFVSRLASAVEAAIDAGKGRRGRRRAARCHPRHRLQHFQEQIVAEFAAMEALRGAVDAARWREAEAALAQRIDEMQGE